MTAIEFRATIAALGLSQVGAAHLVGVDPRTSRRWASGEVPVTRSVELLLRLMVERGIGPADVARLGATEPHPVDRTT